MLNYSNLGPVGRIGEGLAVAHHSGLEDFEIGENLKYYPTCSRLNMREMHAMPHYQYSGQGLLFC